MAHGYQISEKEIDKTLNYLRIFRPDLATPEMAIDILESMLVTAHKASHGEIVNFEDAIEQAIKDIEEAKAKKQP